MVLHLLIIILFSYLLGTISFSFIFSKVFAQKNPGNEGSGNYGALNSYQITNKKTVGLLVLLGDALKGATAVCFTYYFILSDSLYVAVAIFFVILGHNYNIFLKFRGGRGLATALGAFLVFNPLLIIVWGLLWLIVSQIIKQKVEIINIWTSVITPFIVYVIPEDIFNLLSYNFYMDIFEYKILAIIICMMVWVAHHRHY